MLSLLSLSVLAVSVAHASASASLTASADVSTPTGSTVDMVSSAWYAGWHSSNFTLTNVSWEKYTHMTYSFAVTVNDVNSLSLEASDPDVLPKFVSAAHDNNVKAMVSVGGWTGSTYFSDLVASASNRTAFVKTVANLATKYNLDGIDFDWEYPGSSGIGCNAVSNQDTTNFLSFLQELRQDPVGKKLVLTAATPVMPWNGPDASPLTDVSGFSKVLDWIAIMNYDIGGPWLEWVGPNAPLNDTCAPAGKQQGSAVSALKAWTGAGMPAHQIVLGVPSYGHGYSLPVDTAIDCSDDSDDGFIASYPPFNQTAAPAVDGDAWSGGAGSDQCGNAVRPGGTFDLWGLIQGGFLFENGTALPGIDYQFDECSQTPFVYNDKTNVLVSFDDARSFTAKGNFIKTNNLRGFSMWEAGGDSNDILLDAIRQGAGLDDGEDEGDC